MSRHDSPGSGLDGPSPPGVRTLRMESHLEEIRRVELDLVRPFFHPGMRVLEIGGGTGYQARIIASWGCEITSLDLASRPRAGDQYYGVKNYDGEHIPFATASFEAVFSSNVLEHVRGLPGLCEEMRRVLVDDGIAVHIVPTASWRFWTSTVHYLYLGKRLLGRFGTAAASSHAPSKSDVLSRQGLAYSIRRALLAGAHGEYPNALSELYYYSRRRWLGVFRRSSFEVIHVGTNHLFYTGYTICPGLPFTIRRRIAGLLGAACHVFVMRAKRPNTHRLAPETAGSPLSSREQARPRHSHDGVRRLDRARAFG